MRADASRSRPHRRPAATSTPDRGRSRSRARRGSIAIADLASPRSRLPRPAAQGGEPPTGRPQQPERRNDEGAEASRRPKNECDEVEEAKRRRRRTRRRRMRHEAEEGEAGRCPPEECLLRTAQARVVTYAAHDKRLARRSATRPSPRPRLPSTSGCSGGKGSLDLGERQAPLRPQRRLPRSPRRLSEAQMEQGPRRPATSPSTSTSPPRPSYCQPLLRPGT